jgi:hypothetical protein
MPQVEQLPTGCRVLVVESEPLFFMGIDLLLAEFGCRGIGPVETLIEVQRVLAKERPSFAFVGIDLGAELEAIAKHLERKAVPFALLANGLVRRPFHRLAGLRDRLYVLRPFHGPTLHAAACSLYADTAGGKAKEPGRALDEKAAAEPLQI